MTVLDLFSGIGGFSLGLEWAGGFKTVAFCEADQKCRRVLRKHWPATKIYIDVTTLTQKRLVADGIPTIDVVTGGFPCQDISTAGKGVGIGGARSGLWKEFARLICEVRPRYAIIENVSALRSRGLSVVLTDLASIGYDAEWHCIPASAIGAPHRRDRIWIISYPRYNAGSTEQKFQCEMQTEEPWRSGKDGMETGDELADTDSQRQSQQKGIEQEFKGRACNCSEEPISHASRRLPHGAGETRTGWAEFTNGGWWQTEPPVCGVAHGFPGRVGQLKQLGNAVVPQIPYLIGRAIMEVEDGKV